ncbi:MAG: transporter [Melioribacteraceae bacterium]|nr:MAG: transporter [Melioribacteraceae bacterium]
MLKHFLFSLILLPLMLSAQTNIPEEYLQQAVENNLALKQAEFGYRQSMAALDQAQSLFLPRVDINARYSLAGGGREIDIPIGDLINPMHTALNSLMQAQVFPANLPNESIPFLREKEHETKLRITQPLFRAQIYHNYKLNDKLAQMESVAKDKYTRELLANVKTSYFNYIQAKEAVKIYSSYREILTENKRISESLVKNGKSTHDVVYTADAELAEIEKNLNSASAKQKSAKYYFNFLLNRDLDAQIVIVGHNNTPPKMRSKKEYLNNALNNREELKQLKLAIEAMENKASIHRSSYLPNLDFAFDYGFQGEKYKFDSDSDFWMASFVLSWNLFNGFGDEAQVNAALFAEKENSAKLEEVKKLIILEIRRSLDHLETARLSVKAATRYKSAAEQSFRLISKRYSEGMTGYFEYLDAFSRVQRADQSLNIEKFNLKKAFIELDKVAALTDITKFNKINNEE